VTLNWETAYATAFQIQTSTDGSTWTPIYSTTTGTGGTQTLNVSGTGRHIRMYGTARATQYGYSLWEFAAFASGPAGAAATFPSAGTVAAAAPSRRRHCARWLSRSGGLDRGQTGSAGRWREGSRRGHERGPVPSR